MEVVRETPGGDWVYVIDSPYRNGLTGLASRRQCRLQLLAQATHHLCVELRLNDRLRGRQAKHTTHDRDAPLHKASLTTGFLCPCHLADRCPSCRQLRRNCEQTQQKSQPSTRWRDCGLEDSRDYFQARPPQDWHSELKDGTIGGSRQRPNTAAVLFDD